MNAVLAAVAFSPPADWHGDVRLTVEVSDAPSLGAGRLGGLGSVCHVPVAVQPSADAPVVHVPAAPLVGTEGTRFLLHVVTVTDADANAAGASGEP